MLLRRVDELCIWMEIVSRFWNLIVVSAVCLLGGSNDVLPAIVLQFS